MLKENSRFIVDLQKTLDICITAFSFIAAYFIKLHAVPGRFGNLSSDPNYYVVLLLIIIAWYIAFKWIGMYMTYRRGKFWQFFVKIVKSCLLGMILLSMAMYLLHIKGVSRLLMGIFLILNIGLLTLSNLLFSRSLNGFEQADTTRGIF